LPDWSALEGYLGFALENGSALPSLVITLGCLAQNSSILVFKEAHPDIRPTMMKAVTCEILINAFDT
jgi:hypothetical protein